MAMHRLSSMPRALTAGVRSFSSTRPAADLARVQLLGNLGAAPQRFSLASGSGEGVRYKVAVNRGKDRPASWFTVVCFDPAQVDRLAPQATSGSSGGGGGGGSVGGAGGVASAEELKGAKVLVDATIDIQPVKDDSGSTVGERVQLRQTHLQIVSRPGASGGSGGQGGRRGADDVSAQRLAGEDSFSG